MCPEWPELKLYKLLDCKWINSSSVDSAHTEAQQAWSSVTNVYPLGQGGRNSPKGTL